MIEPISFYENNHTLINHTLLAIVNFAMAQEKVVNPLRKRREGVGKTGKENGKDSVWMASFYHSKFHGRKTSSGEKYDQDKMTGAHNGLPLNTWIRVTNIRNGRTVVVKINDRLHHRNERLVDLSRSAASKLGYIGRGLARVKIEVLGKIKPTEIAKKDL